MTTSKPSVIDVSHYQGTVDFEEVKAAGILGVIIKASEGTTSIDSLLSENMAGAYAAGLPYATYHYLHHGDVTTQMQHYLDVVDPTVGERVCIDFEDQTCTLDDLHQAVKYLLGDVRDLQITVYGGALLKELLGSSFDELLAKNTSLWLAQFTSGKPSWPTGTWQHYTLWQYSDQGRVAGIEGEVDWNVFNGSDDNLVKWLGPAMVAPVPVPEAIANISITVQSDYPARVTIVPGNNVTLVNA